MSKESGLSPSQSSISPAIVYPDVIGLLKADHRKAEALFSDFEHNKETLSSKEKFALVKEVCGELLIHMAIEEGIFYPKVQEAIKDQDLVNEARVEHDAAKTLIIQLGDMSPDDPMFDATVAVLAEQIARHVQEEETTMFAKVLVSDIDLVVLGMELLDAKNDMRVRLGLPVKEVALKQ